MKDKQQGFALILVAGIVSLFIIGTLGLIFWQNFIASRSTLSHDQADPQPTTTTNLPSPNVKFEEWKVGFSSKTHYELKLNSNKSAYFISIKDLADTCKTPDTPWIGIITRFNPQDKMEVGPDKGKTFDQILGSQAKNINGKLYRFNTTTKLCTRDQDNSQVEKAAHELENEMKTLRAY